MKIKYGTIITSGSGSVSGITVARNHYGYYARARTSPINQNTARQITLRNHMRTLSAAWNDTLTTAQRAGWTLYGQNVPMIGKLGETIHLPGKEHYIRSNVPRLLVPTTRIDDPPTTFSIPAAATGLSVTFDESAQTIILAHNTTDAWANEVGGWLLFLMGRPQNPSRAFYGSPWKYADSLAGAVVPPVSPFTTNVTFPVAQGQRVWLQCRVLRADGRVSTPFLLNGLGVA